MPQEPALTAAEQILSDAWDEHLRTEFSAHSADEAIATMAANPLINQVPVMIGGNGKEEVYAFYAKYFLSQIPPGDDPGVADYRPGEARVRDRHSVHPHYSNGLDAAGYPAHR